MSRLLQVILALVGIVLTGVLQHASNRNAEVQNAQGLVQLYTQEVAAALQTCNPSMLQVAQDTAVELNELRARGILKGNTDFEEHVVQVGDTMPTCVRAGAAQGGQSDMLGATPGAAPEAPVAPALVAQSRNLELRRLERSVVQAAIEAATRDAGRHFAVLASYAINDDSTFDDQLGAAAHYNQLVNATREAGLQVQVYRTSASNHFAIVVPADSSDAARDLVAQARRNGWAPDAFAQVERNWTPCPNPGTTAALRACAGDAVNRPSRGPVAMERLRTPD